MTSAQLTQILAEAQLALQQNKALVTPALLTQVNQLISILGTDDHGIYMAAGVDLPTIVTALQALVAHEQVLIGTGNGDGMQDTLLASIQTIQGRPLEIDIIAPLLG